MRRAYSRRRLLASFARGETSIRPRWTWTSERCPSRFRSMYWRYSARGKIVSARARAGEKHQGERERELNESSFAKQRSLSPQNGVNIFLLVSSFDFLQSRMLSKKWNSQRIICLRISFQNVFGAHFLHKITNINRFTDGCTDKSTHALRFIYIAHTHTRIKKTSSTHPLSHPLTRTDTQACTDMLNASKWLNPSQAPTEAEQNDCVFSNCRTIKW